MLLFCFPPLPASSSSAHDPILALEAFLCRLSCLVFFVPVDRGLVDLARSLPEGFGLHPPILLTLPVRPPGRACRPSAFTTSWVPYAPCLAQPLVVFVHRAVRRQPPTMFRYALLHLLAATLVSGHILITYPGSRGNNFITNETFPFGMQWHYPCESITLIGHRHIQDTLYAGEY